MMLDRNYTAEGNHIMRMNFRDTEMTILRHTELLQETETRFIVQQDTEILTKFMMKIKFMTHLPEQHIKKPEVFGSRFISGFFNAMRTLYERNATVMRTQYERNARLMRHIKLFYAAQCY